MHKQFLISVLLAASLAFWCGCGGQQAQDPESGGQQGVAEGEGQTGTAKLPSGTGAHFEKLDTAYISSDFAAAVVVRPKRAMESKLATTVHGLPDVLQESMGLQRVADTPYGKQAASIAQWIVLWAPAEAAPAAPEKGSSANGAPAKASPPVLVGTIVRFTDAKAAAEMSDPWTKEGDERAHGTKTYYVRTFDLNKINQFEVPTGEVAAKLKQLEPVFPGAEFQQTKSADGKTTTIVVGYKRNMQPGDINAAYLPDDKTVVAAPEALLKKMMDAKNVESALLDRLTALGAEHDLAAVAMVDQLRPAVEAVVEEVGEVPAFLSPLVASLNETRAATVTADIDGEPLLRIDVEAENAGGAEQLESQIKNLLQIGQGTYGGSVKNMVQQAPEAKPLYDITDKVVNGVSVTRNGTHVVATAPGLTGLEGLAEKLKPLAAKAGEARRWSNLRQIGAAVLAYPDEFGGVLPRYVVTDDGKPLLSWRVTLLPSLGNPNLWSEFDLHQSWDSKRNKPPLDKMPAVFKMPVGEPKPNHTVYLMFQGPGTILDGKLNTLDNITDDRSDTILAIEVSPEKAVPWTQPLDLDVETFSVQEALGPPPTEKGYPAVFFDGRVAVVPATLEMDVFMRLVRINDGQPSGFKADFIPYEPLPVGSTPGFLPPSAGGAAPGP